MVAPGQLHTRFKTPEGHFTLFSERPTRVGFSAQVPAHAGMPNSCQGRSKPLCSWRQCRIEYDQIAWHDLVVCMASTVLHRAPFGAAWHEVYGLLAIACVSTCSAISLVTGCVARQTCKSG